MAVALVTGFEPYGGRGLNPSAEIIKVLDGNEISGLSVIARTLPVTLDGLSERVQRLLRETQPQLVINLGLAPGTPVIRLERLAVNWADFEIPDNTGQVCRDQPLDAEGPAALWSSLPLRLIEQRLLAAGIPACLSNSAGMYLCNATMYWFLRSLQQAPETLNVPCGFIHLPYLPAQVVELIQLTRSGQKLELEQRSDMASMELSTLIQAVRLMLSEASASSAELL